jgi:hypothetical protein
MITAAVVAVASLVADYPGYRREPPRGQISTAPPGPAAGS